jgi:hypothetical protein
VRRLFVGLLLGALLATVSCGGGSSASTQDAPLSGNWQIILTRHVNPDPPLIFTGFLLQSGNAVTGSVILGSNCAGVGPVAGTVDGQNLALTINEFGQNVSLTGTMPSGSTPMGGQFSNLAGGCTDFANTGTWSAIRVTPISGSFHGTFESSTYGTLEVAGTLTQGPNTGGSNATLTGTMTATSAPHFCSFLTVAAVTGLISGTTVALNLYGPNGSQITQIGTPSDPLTVTPDGKSMVGRYAFPTVSSTCTSDQGAVQLTFP